MLNLGTVEQGSTIFIPFSSVDADGAASAFDTAIEVADFNVYKDGSTTQRTSTAGFTVAESFDSLAGLNGLFIDLSDNTDAGFYANGSVFTVALVPDETLDTLAVATWIATFRIEEDAEASTRVLNDFYTNYVIGATGNDTTHLHLEGLSVPDDALNDEWLIVQDVSTGQFYVTRMTGWVLSTELATVETLPFTPEASVDRYWRTGVKADSGVANIQSRLPTALVAGKIDADAVAISGSTAAADAVQANIGNLNTSLSSINTLVGAIKVITDALTSAGATKLASSAAGIITGSAETGTLSTTVATTDLTGYANDQLIGRILVVTSGDAEGEATDITDYAATGGTLTFTALTTAMGNGDTFVIL